MGDVRILTDEDFDSVLAEDRQPVMLQLRGDGLRGDFSAEFTKAAQSHDDLMFGQVDVDTNPRFAEHFNAGGKAVLAGLYKGETLVRRKKPWGTDVPLAVEMLQQAVTDDPDASPAEADAPISERTEPQEEKSPVDTQPVTVTDADFQQEVIDHELPVVVDFWAPWCGPCKMVAPILDKLAEEYAGKVRVAKVNVDENPGLAQYFQIMSIPTMMMLKNRTIVFNQPGALPEPSLRNLFDQLVDLEVPPPEEQEQQEEQQETNE